MFLIRSVSLSFKTENLTKVLCCFTSALEYIRYNKSYLHLIYFLPVNPFQHALEYTLMCLVIVRYRVFRTDDLYFKHA